MAAKTSVNGRAKTHTLLAVTCLGLAFHTVVLVRFSYGAQPVGWVTAVLTAAGTVSAVLVLLGRVGAGCKARGVIKALDAFPALNILETTLRLDEGWHGHQPGQFAFVTSSRAEGAHSCTIALARDPADRRISFVTKALGDHTAELPQKLQLGHPVVVEGPYGRFTFGGPQQRQNRIGAGIGITPFIARMKQLAREGCGARAIDLHHPTAVDDPKALGKLRAEVPGWREASVWFCGSAGFCHALRADLVAQDLPGAALHQELFQMR